MKTKILKILIPTAAHGNAGTLPLPDIPLLPAGAPKEGLNAVLQAAPTPIFYTDLQGRCLGGNEAFQRWFGLNPDQLHDWTISNILQRAQVRSCEQVFDGPEPAGQNHSFEFRILCADGQIRDASCTQAFFFDPLGEAAGIVGTLYDLTRHKAEGNELLQQAHHDTVTGLPNRLQLQRQLDQLLQEGEASNQQIAVIALELDRFKAINEPLGYALSERLLKKIAQRLRAAIRSRDLLGKTSRDEFTLILPGCIHRQYAEFAVERILSFLAEPIEIDGHEIFCTASLGVAFAPDNGRNTEQLLQKAETAMYQAKAQGKNTYQCFHQEMETGALMRMTLESALRRGIRNEELFLNYQPLVEAQSGRLIGVEALVRWRHPELGVVSPVKFIPVAEESGLILPLGEWVLKTACAQNQAWQQAGLPPVRMAVNLSGHQLKQPGFVAMVETILTQTGLDPSWLELELTETTMMENTEENIRTLEKLHGLGLRLAIDDFGTGYSSLGYLKRFPIDKLKVDRSFVSNITTDSDHAAITDAIIAMAHSLRFKVVAEGVETAEQFAHLCQRGCDELQGYFFGKPMTAEELQTLLVAGKPLP